MPRTLTASRKNRLEALWFVLLFAAIMQVSIVIMGACAVEGRRALAAMLIGLFWGAWTLAAIYYWRLYLKHELRLDDDRITSRGLFWTRSVAVDEVTLCRWRPTTGFSVRLVSPQGSLWIHLERYDRDDWPPLIRFLRGAIPLEKQEGWDLFCHKVALPSVTPPIGDEEPLPPGYVRTTRRTWDYYLLPWVAIAGIGGASAAWWSNTPRFLAAPLGLIFLWLVLRFGTPKNGMISPTINSNPSGWAFLKFLALWYLVAIAGFIMHSMYLKSGPFGNSFGIGMALTWFAILLWRARAADKSRIASEQPAAEESVRTWEQQGGSPH